MSDVPSFSIVIETENLATGDLSDLDACLDSIAAQGLDRLRPNEILLVESGQIERSVVDVVLAKYPWLTVHVAPRPLHYYAAKLAGARLATGDVVVFADSDLRYESGWLAALLAPFEDRDVSFVSGETRIDITGPYTFSVATTWLFPRRYAPGDASSLIANNAAVRRAALLACPFPADLPLYRAQIVIHGRLVRKMGRRILNVKAKGFHAPPRGFGEWALRFAIAGADSVQAATYVVDDEGHILRRSWFSRRVAAWVRISARKLASSVVRTAQSLFERPSRAIYLPVALPVSMTALALFVAGGLSSVFKSDLTYRRMSAFEMAAGGVRTMDSGSPR